MRQVGEGAARWKEMLKGTGIGFQSPTVNLSKLPKLSGPRVKVELGMRAPGWLDSRLPGAGPLAGAGGKQPAGTKGKPIRFPAVGKQPRQREQQEQFLGGGRTQPIHGSERRSLSV